MIEGTVVQESYYDEEAISQNTDHDEQALVQEIGYEKEATIIVTVHDEEGTVQKLTIIGKQHKETD
jgi:hypothetical protein